MMSWYSKPLVLSLAIGLAGAPLAFAQEHHDEPGHDEPGHPVAKPEPRPPTVVNKNVVVHEHTVVHKTVVDRTVHPVAHPVVASGGGGRWHSGQHFDGNRAVFTDYDRYHVRRPPPGYEWVQDGGELVLISLGTGVISDTFVITIP
jgi:Ni/Co efflux regulator RcnB